MEPVNELLSESFRLRSDAQLTSREDGAPVLRQTRYQLALDGLSVGARAVVQRLAEGWTTDVELSAVLTRLEGPDRVLHSQLLIRRLVIQSWLRRRLGLPGRPLVEIVPRGLGAGSVPPAVRHADGVGYRLSRFALLRAEDGVLVADTPRSTVSAALVDPVLAGVLAAAAHGPIGSAEVGTVLGLGALASGRLLDELIAARVLVDEPEAVAEREELPLAAWAPHELWFHDRSRAGRHVLPLGGTFPLRDRVDPAPIAHAYPHRPQVELAVPDMDLAVKRDPTLAAVVSDRVSNREQDAAAPIDRDQLAEFLYRTQRLLSVQDGYGHETGRRPYPGGGGLCELEVYPVITRCLGLEPGVFHYDSSGHRLARLADVDAAGTRLLRFAQAAATLPAPPQVCLVITARVQRVMWKYEGMSYSLLLKHAGVLTELMYLVATAMGLAPCAIGTGDAAAFAAATGIDPLVEPSVADFVLGSRP